MSTELNIFGWAPDKQGSAAYAAELQDDKAFWDDLRARDKGEDRFSYRALSLCLLSAPDWVRQRWLLAEGRVKSYNQLNIGSCVGNSEAKRASYQAALDIWLRLEREEFRAMFSPEASYALSREECGMLGRGDGSTGYGAARANTKWGVLPQGVYDGVDCREYTVERCAAWGRTGLPQPLRDDAALHKSTNYVAVDTAEKAWLIAGVVPFNMCSSIGWADQQVGGTAEMAAGGRVFGQDRDEDGALRRRGSWMHSMCAGAARRTTKKGRRLILVDQSWGDGWCGGGYYLDQPAGSFYADVDDIGRAVEQGDTFADLGYMGFQRPAGDLSFTRM